MKLGEWIKFSDEQFRVDRQFTAQEVKRIYRQGELASSIMVQNKLILLLLTNSTTFVSPNHYPKGVIAAFYDQEKEKVIPIKEFGIEYLVEV